MVRKINNFVQNKKLVLHGVPAWSDHAGPTSFSWSTGAKAPRLPESVAFDTMQAGTRPCRVFGAGFRPAYAFKQGNINLQTKLSEGLHGCSSRPVPTGPGTATMQDHEGSFVI